MAQPILTKIIKINPHFPEVQKIKVAADFLRKGSMVAFPTETVYGLAVNLDNEKALKRLYEVKKRSLNKPITVHIANIEKLEELAAGIPDYTFKLTDKFWPGPLTLILTDKKNNSQTVAFRFPDHPITLGIINESRCLVGATSANVSDSQAAKSVEEVLEQFDGLIDMVVDGGEVKGVESTIVDLSSFPPKITRDGAIADKVKVALDEILSLKTKIILLVCTGNSCRSPMAQGYLGHLLKGREDIEIISAGVSTVSGTLATPEAIKVMAECGIDISGHLARGLTDETIKKADLILVMEKSHKETILRRVPVAKGKVYLLKEFGRKEKILPDENLDIADPIGAPLEIYQKSFAVIKEELERIAKLL